MAAPTIAVVILNWNGKHLLERFLAGIQQHTPDYADIVVADNGSTDGSVSYLRECHPDVHLVLLDKNYGYAGGYNRALRQLQADYFVLLNSDMKVGPGWLQPCIQLMEEDPGVAAVQPKIRSLDVPGHFEYAGAAGGYVDVMGYPFCRGRIFNTVERDEGQYDQEADLFWASGAAMCVRSESFFAAGGFDDRFFAHMEEIDLCWRLHHLSQRIVSCPRSIVYHMGGGSLPASSPAKTYYNFRNSLWTMAKNLPARVFYPWLVLRLALDELAAVRFLIQGKGRDFLAVVRAHIAFWCSFRTMRRKSRQIPGALPPAIYRRSIVFDYFLFGRKYFTRLEVRASTAKK